MIDFLKFRTFGIACSLTCALRLTALFAFITLSGQSSFAQGTELFKCPEKEYPFTGDPQQTLCEENPNFICQTQIGVGTLYPRSSLWGASITGDVCIIGDFEIDAPFTFQNATVKINTGVTIAIKPSPNGYDPGSSLGIDNSKLFACNGLWKGITLGHLSTIGTQNNSVIEDAETAIYASGLCALSIEQTTFNRDRVGIHLNTPSPSVFVPGPLIWTFSNNHFTCDAPLNGTMDEITTAGVKLKDSFLGTYSGTNTFTDIQYGIYSEGGASYIGCQNLIFQRIRRDGIYMDQGNINLRASQFVNGNEKGIHIVTANNVTVSNNCNFTWDNNLPLNTPGSDANFYYGLHIEKFALGSLTSVAGNLFFAEIANGQQRVVGTWFEGADVAGGTVITMTQNNWQLYGGAAIGVLINGDFPSTSQIDIYNNAFDVNGHLGVGAPLGIFSEGNRYDFDIIGNHFFSSPPINLLSAPTGIDLSGSEGIDNEVSENHWEQGILMFSYLNAIRIGNYKNTLFCSNTFATNNRSFSCFGSNDGTVLTRNIAHGSQLIMLYDQSWIEDQEHGGNQWTAQYQGADLILIATPQAECMGPNYANFSDFFVHTAQSTAYSGPGFNPFHPKDLLPDNNIEWWIEDDDTPAEGCLAELTDPGDGNTNLKKLVANGTFGAEFSDNPSMIWQTQRALFFALKRTPALESEYAAYSTFMAAKTGSNIDKFYQVFSRMDAAKNGSDTLVTNAQNNQVAINNLLVLLEADDSAWHNAINPTEKENAQNDKKQHVGDLMQLLSAAAGFQASYKQDLQSELINIQLINNSVSPIGDWEMYEKVANDIIISYLLNEGITEVQKDQLEAIATVCPNYGGMAVYRARSILPECSQILDWDNYEGCFPAPTLLEPAEYRSISNQAFQNTAIAKAQPNPAKGSTMLIIPEGKQGNIEIVNTFGQVVMVQKIMSAQTSIDLVSIPTGTYFLKIEYSDGKHESLRIIVTR